MQGNLLPQGSNTCAWTRKNTECFKRGDLSHTGADRKNQCQYCSDILQGRLSILYISGFVSTMMFFLLSLQQTDIDSLLVSLRIEALYVKENFNIHWVSEDGMVENIEQITEEYKQTRGLLVR